jgi:hypothetical protein
MILVRKSRDETKSYHILEEEKKQRKTLPGSYRRSVMETVHGQTKTEPRSCSEIRQALCGNTT